ncbi:MAG: hypothetical protein QM689_10910 [Oscillospiraceae bacterium]
MKARLFITAAALLLCLSVSACGNDSESVKDSTKEGTKASTTTTSAATTTAATTASAATTTTLASATESKTSLSKADIQKIYISDNRKTVEIQPDSDACPDILSKLSVILQDDQCGGVDGEITREKPGGLYGFSDGFFVEIDFAQPQKLTFGSDSFTAVTALFYRSDEAVIYLTDESDLSGEITSKAGYLYRNEAQFTSFNQTIEPLLS